MARVGVTQGACSGVPISGVAWPLLTGQVTCSASRATGADRSEPHGHLCPAARHRMYRTLAPARRACARCTRGGRMCQGQCQRRADTRGGRVHIRRCRGLLVGQGRGSNGARTVSLTVPETVPLPHPHPSPDPPDTDHLTPDTRHPAPLMYPGYLVTRCRPLRDLLLPYPISAKVPSWPCGSHEGALKRVYDKLCIISTVRP